MSYDPAMPSRTTLLVIGCGVALVAGIGLAALQYNGVSDGKRDPNTPASRRDFAQIISKSMPGSIWTEGARSEVLVVDMKDCTPRSLSALVQREDIAGRLAQFGFSSVRCTDGVEVDGPWDTSGDTGGGAKVDPWAGTEP